MTDHRGSVILLSGRGGAVNRQPPHVETLQALVKQLDQLGCRLQEFSPQSTWLAQQWMIASTPFRMRLTSGRKGLGGLAIVCAIGERPHDRWALELSDARCEAERWLRDIAVCLHVLQQADTSPAERERQTEVFVSARSELLEVLTEIRHMVAQRLPVGPDAS
jgi:hypothetical protein